MKVKLQAGAELDLLTKDEATDVMRGAVQDWVQQAMIGAKLVEIYAQGTVTAAGALTIGGESGDLTAGNTGPESGLVWSVHWYCPQGLQIADTLTMYRGTATASRFVRGDVNGYQSYGRGQLVLRPGIKLQWSGQNLATPTGSVVSIVGQAWEMPSTMMYRLL